MNHGQLVQLLEEKRGKRTWAMLAREIGVSQSFLSRVLGGWCGPGKKIMAFLGVREETVYVKTEQPQ